jgi:NDP-sugar pyrophosphorylase family protein
MQTIETKINPDFITAFIPAAGYGSRLGSLTQNKPKALAEVNGIPLLAHVIRKLTSLGISKFTVNVHHFAELIRDFLKSNEFTNLDIRLSDETDALMDTGGGLIKASRLVDDNCQAILVHNVDILTDINLTEALSAHFSGNHDVTLIVSDRYSSRKLIFDNQMNLTGWINLTTGEELMANGKGNNSKNLMAFSGIHIVNPAIMRKIDIKAIPLTKLYLSLTEHLIRGHTCTPSYFFDMGKPDDLLTAESFLQQKQFRNE